jgi:hypothetical protein
MSRWRHLGCPGKPLSGAGATPVLTQRRHVQRETPNRAQTRGVFRSCRPKFGDVLLADAATAAEFFLGPPQRHACLFEIHINSRAYSTPDGLFVKRKTTPVDKFSGGLRKPLRWLRLRVTA